MGSLGKPAIVMVDLGPIPIEGGSLTISMPGCLASTPCVAALAGIAPPGKDVDELEMDALAVWATPAVDSCTIHIRGLEGSIYGIFAVNYCAG